MARLSDAEKAARQTTVQHLRDIIEKLHGEVRAVWRSRLSQDAQRARAADIQAQIDALNHAIRVLGNGEEEG